MRIQKAGGTVRQKAELASLIKMINDLRIIKRIGKSQSWVSSLMILKEDNFGISYRNLSHSHRPQFYLFVYLFIYFWKGYSHIDNLLTRSSISSLPLCQKRRRLGNVKKSVKTNFVFTRLCSYVFQGRSSSWCLRSVAFNRRWQI